MTSEYIATTMLRAVRKLKPTTLYTRPLAAAPLRQQHTQSVSTTNHLYNTNNIVQFSEIHQYLNASTHLAGPTKLDTPINAVVPLSAKCNEYLAETQATYKHVCDMKYRLHRFVNENESAKSMLSVDILVDHSIEHNTHTEFGHYDVCVINGSERITFACQPLFYRHKLVNPNIVDTITITDVFSHQTRQLLASDMPTDAMLQFFNTIGINYPFIEFVQQHAFDIYRSEEMQ